MIGLFNNVSAAEGTGRFKGLPPDTAPAGAFTLRKLMTKLQKKKIKDYVLMSAVPYIRKYILKSMPRALILKEVNDVVAKTLKEA